MRLPEDDLTNEERAKGLNHVEFDLDDPDKRALLGVLRELYPSASCHDCGKPGKTFYCRPCFDKRWPRA